MCLPFLSLAADPEDYLRDGQSYFDKGEYEAAVIQLKNALLADPDNGQARLLLGQAYLELEQGTAAEKELNRAQELGISRDSVLVPLGQAWLMTGKADKVLQTITVEAGDSATLKTDILVLQGQAYLADRKQEMAEMKFSDALELQPDTTDALLGKAYIAYQKEDRETTGTLITRVLELDTGNTEAWTMKGGLLRDAGKSKEAIAAFQKALDTQPGNVQARLGKATSLIANGEEDKALTEIDVLLERSQNLFQAHFLKALALYQQQKMKQAHESVQEAIRLAPAHLPTQLLAGTIAYQQGQLNQAEEYLSGYRRADPGNRHAAMLLGATLLKLNKPGKAIEVLESALPSAQEDAQYLALLGSAYLLQGNASKGLEHLEHAAEAAPDAAGIRTQLAIAQLLQGDVDKAAGELETIVELEQGLMQADVLLVMTHLKRGDFEQALAAADALAGKMPDSPVPQNLRGSAYLGMDKRTAAKDAFEAALGIDANFLPAQLNLARLDVLAGDTAAAEARYRKVLSSDKGNLNVLLSLAALAENEGQPEKVDKWLREAHKHHPDAIKPALMLVGHYLRQGDTTRALDITKNLAASHPGSPVVLEALANVQLSAGRDEDARATLLSLTQAAPQSAEAHYLLARVQLKKGENAAARSSLLRALDLQADYPLAKFALGRLEIAEQNYDAAFTIADDLQKSHPDAPYGDELRGDIHSVKKEPNKATGAYALAYRKLASAQVARKLYHSHREAGQEKAAREALGQWLAEHPEDVSVRSLLAMDLLNAGLHTPAAGEYRTILEHDPDNIAALNNLAWIHQKDGDPGGIEYAERAYEVAPERVEVIDTLGWLLVQNGDTNRGLVLLQEAAVKAPHLGEIRYHLAVALEKAGRREEAQKELKRLLAANKDFPDREQAEALLKQLEGTI